MQDKIQNLQLKSQTQFHILQKSNALHKTREIKIKTQDSDTMPAEKKMKEKISSIIATPDSSNYKYPPIEKDKTQQNQPTKNIKKINKKEFFIRWYLQSGGWFILKTKD